MGQDGTRSSFPASFFEIDDFDSHWEAERDGERPRSSRRDAESSKVKASYPPPPPAAGAAEALELSSLPPLELDLDLGDEPPSGEFAVDRVRVSEPELPLIHGANVPVTPQGPTERPPRRAGSTAPTERPAVLPEPPHDPALRRTVPRPNFPFAEERTAPPEDAATRRTVPEPRFEPHQLGDAATRRTAPEARFEPSDAATRRTAPQGRFALDEQRAEPPPTVRPGLRQSLASSPDFSGSDFEEPLLTEEEAEQSQGDRPTFPDDPMLDEVRDRYATGDYSGALVMAEGILQHDSENSLTRRYADHCRMVLEQMAVSRLGSLAQVPRVSVEGDRLRWLSLDHRAGFLLSLIDGGSSIEELLDISCMPRFEALKILCDLLDQDVILLSRAER
jgi:hypothetical protein